MLYLTFLVQRSTQHESIYFWIKLYTDTPLTTNRAKVRHIDITNCLIYRYVLQTQRSFILVQRSIFAKNPQTFPKIFLKIFCHSKTLWSRAIFENFVKITCVHSVQCIPSDNLPNGFDYSLKKDRRSKKPKMFYK